MNLVEIGSFGPVETPCHTGRWFWYRERHAWTEWEPDGSGDYVHKCTRCPWVEFGATPEAHKARLDAIRLRLDAGERIFNIINDDR